jgi:RimJ/RimL family protein N-acetyltransferase
MSTLRLVKYNDTHRESLVQLLDNPNVAHTLLVVNCPYTYADADNWLTYTKTADENVSAPFAIEADGVHVGGIGLRKKHFGHSREVGYWIGEPYWGRGYATEAIRLITEFGFNELKLERIQAHVFESNIASEKALLKNGFAFEALLKKMHEKNGVFYNSKLFGKVI